jgi:hypothetical protein
VRSGVRPHSQLLLGDRLSQRPRSLVDRAPISLR